MVIKEPAAIAGAAVMVAASVMPATSNLLVNFALIIIISSEFYSL